MKYLRTFLLVLLTVLLPIRGAVAAAMQCPPSSSGGQAKLAMGSHVAGHDDVEEMMSHGHAHGHEHEAEQAHTSSGPDDGRGHDHAASEGCNACAAYCSLTPLLSSMPKLAAPPDPTAVKFSPYAASAPSFVSDQQDRPPRTL